MDNLEKKVLQLISDQFNTPVEKLTSDTSFKDDLNADSLDLVELVMAMEVELGLEADDADMDSITTIGDCLDFVKTAQNQ
ncbi:MAG: acyl carrier protein [Ezakiella sp.]|nr:acyl carrier protein [Ezakiella sp.]MDD7762104.1 acyl carrier protein [Bacillota bacterium]MDY3947045.1 acyl carrier protein [Ezakiella sp.]